MSGRRYLQDIIKNLQEYYKCPSCSTNYFFDDIKFLGQIDAYCFVQLTCHACSLPVVATVGTGATQTKKSKKVKSDLNRSESGKFAKLGPISADEIAGFHAFLQTYRGGWEEIS